MIYDILKECLGEDRSYAFLSGPSFAREICEGVATAVVIASEDLLLADDLADIKNTSTTSGANYLLVGEVLSFIHINTNHIYNDRD